MARFLVKIRDRYLDWSTVVDAPVTGGMTRDELREYYLAEYGPQEMNRFDQEVALADRAGASADYDWRNYNRAGPEETSLTEDQLYKVYCLGKTLDEEVVRRKVEDRRKADARRRPAPRPVNDKPSSMEVRAAFASISINASLDEVQSLLGTPSETPRKMGSSMVARWQFDELVIACHFDPASGKLTGKQLSPNYRMKR